jgi:hypothetical protein
MKVERGRRPATLPRMIQRSSFRYFGTSPEVIRLAVMMYVRFPFVARRRGPGVRSDCKSQFPCGTFFVVSCPRNQIK